MFSFFSKLQKKISIKRILKFLRRLKQGHSWFRDFNRLENVGKTDERVHRRKFPNDNSVRAIFPRRKLKYNIQNWTWLAEEYISKNSTKAIRTFALDFYEVRADPAYASSNITSKKVRAHNLIVE